MNFTPMQKKQLFKTHNVCAIAINFIQFWSQGVIYPRVKLQGENLCNHYDKGSALYIPARVQHGTRNR